MVRFFTRMRVLRCLFTMVFFFTMVLTHFLCKVLPPFCYLTEIRNLTLQVGVNALFYHISVQWLNDFLIDWLTDQLISQVILVRYLCSLCESGRLPCAVLSANLTKLICSSCLSGNPRNPTKPALHCETVFLLFDLSVLYCLSSLDFSVRYRFPLLVFLYDTTFLPFGLLVFLYGRTFLFCSLSVWYCVPQLWFSCMLLPSSSLYCPLYVDMTVPFLVIQHPHQPGCTMELIAQWLQYTFCH